jgi:hypothetical protein
MTIGEGNDLSDQRSMPHLSVGCPGIDRVLATGKILIHYIREHGRCEEAVPVR